MCFSVFDGSCNSKIAFSYIAVDLKIVGKANDCIEYTTVNALIGSQEQ